MQAKLQTIKNKWKNLKGCQKEKTDYQQQQKNHTDPGLLTSNNRCKNNNKFKKIF